MTPRNQRNNYFLKIFQAKNFSSICNTRKYIETKSITDLYSITKELREPQSRKQHSHFEWGKQKASSRLIF